MQCKTVSIISTPIALSSRMYKMLAKWCFEIIEFLQILKIIVEWELEMGPRRKRADDTDDICFWHSQCQSINLQKMERDTQYPPTHSTYVFTSYHHTRLFWHTFILKWYKCMLLHCDDCCHYQLLLIFYSKWPVVVVHLLLLVVVTAQSARERRASKCHRKPL